MLNKLDLEEVQRDVINMPTSQVLITFYDQLMVVRGDKSQTRMLCGQHCWEPFSLMVCHTKTVYTKAP